MKDLTYEVYPTMRDYALKHSSFKNIKMFMEAGLDFFQNHQDAIVSLIRYITSYEGCEMEEKEKKTFIKKFKMHIDYCKYIPYDSYSKSVKNFQFFYIHVLLNKT